MKSSSIRVQNWGKVIARRNGERLIAKVWNFRGVLVLTCGDTRTVIDRP